MSSGSHRLRHLSFACPGHPSFVCHPYPPRPRPPSYLSLSAGVVRMLPIGSRSASSSRRAVGPPQVRRWPRLLRPLLERLESRETPALALTYGGPGTALTLSEAGAAAADNVTISEPVAGTLRIDLNGATFDAGSTTAATGLTYQN